jgi:predicted double-glycine peptidase
MKVQLDVPFYAQHEIVDKDGHLSCGIVCVKMVIDFAGGKDGEIHDLIEEANIVGGKEKAGWKHETLIRVLRNHGILAYSQEFKSHDIDLNSEQGAENREQTKIFRALGIEKIKGSIDYGFPVIASVKPEFNGNPENHIVLIVGYDKDTLYVQDPQRKGQEKDPMPVSIEKFLEYWKNLTIFVEF